ncbi:MAG: hypothetical protein QOK23_3887, partial [Gammaproteobacteria bacterium]|nr:hypothetical protein [Gammaproteobacteria bacterium]
DDNRWRIDHSSPGRVNTPTRDSPLDGPFGLLPFPAPAAQRRDSDRNASAATLRFPCFAAVQPVLLCTGVRRLAAHPWFRGGQLPRPWVIVRSAQRDIGRVDKDFRSHLTLPDSVRCCPRSNWRSSGANFATPTLETSSSWRGGAEPASGVSPRRPGTASAQ